MLMIERRGRLRLFIMENFYYINIFLKYLNKFFEKLYIINIGPLNN